jgi:uncharacterized SAM-binding protein YcdF (DUF218 family)
MFFILSKTLNYLVLPLTMVVILLLLSAVLKNTRWKKILFWTGFGLLLFFSNDFIANEAMRIWEIQTKSYQEVKPHTLGIVLTGATLSNMKPDDRVYFARGADRVIHAVQLYKLGLLKKILISGGSGSLSSVDEPEADKFRKAMILMGVDSTSIMIENETRNTHESAVEVRKMLDSMNIKSEDCLLITSAFHMRRSLACYRKVDLNLEPFSTDFYAHAQTYHIDAFIIPKLDALTIWHKLFKEWAGFAAYKMAGYL